MTLKTTALKFFVSILLLLCQFEVNNCVEVKCLSNSTDICDIREPINGNDESLTVLTSPEQDQSTIVTLELASLSEVIPSVLFQRFPDIKVASFAPNVKAISKVDFRDAKNLLYLKLDGNHLKVVPREVFASATKLHTVDLSSNDITDVEDYAFSGATDLNCVRLNKNNLTIIRNSTFAGAPKLTRIELEENQIAVVEEGAFDIPSLEELFFESNRMKQLPYNIFRNAPNLEFKKHRCVCGEMVKENGHHGLSCMKTGGHYARHADFNKIMSAAMSSARVPNILEPPGLSRDDGKRPDGVSLIPWSRGKAILWDSTVRNTLAASYLHNSSRTAGSVAEEAERRKHNHYIQLKKDYHFTPLAFETLGPMGPDTRAFLTKLGGMIRKETGEKRSLDYLLQKLSISIQRGNAACILGTFGKKLTDDFIL